MTDQIQLDQAVRSFMAGLEPSRRRKTLRRMINELKRINSRRMAQEKGPDGTAWPERKGPPRSGKPAKMMAGLRRNLKAAASSDRAVLGFPGRAGKIALVHHKGLSDAVAPGGPMIRYQVRELIGLADGDLEQLESILLEGIK